MIDASKFARAHEISERVDANATAKDHFSQHARMPTMPTMPTCLGPFSAS